ncbi:MAG: GNAT family N-acetyltransferase [Bacteroidales bacterium]
MNIHFLEHKDINMQKWDECIDGSVNVLPYAYSWYLDTVSPSWKAIVDDGYQAVFPLTGKQKYGVHYLAQPPFTQQLGLFAKCLISEELLSEFINKIPAFYKLVEINLNAFNKPGKIPYKTLEYINLELPLLASYEQISKGYSKNLKRNLKKARQKDLHLVSQVNPAEVIRMFRLNRGRHIKTLKKNDYLTLEQLIYKMGKRGYVELHGVFTGRSSLCAAAVFIRSKHRLIFLFSALNDEGRQVGAMPFLLDEVIRKFSGKTMILDFEGSNDANLARFYRSFGANEVKYPVLRDNSLSWAERWALKLLKRVK